MFWYSIQICIILTKRRPISAPFPGVYLTLITWPPDLSLLSFFPPTGCNSSKQTQWQHSSGTFKKMESYEISYSTKMTRLNISQIVICFGTFCVCSYYLDRITMWRRCTKYSSAQNGTSRSTRTYSTSVGASRSVEKAIWYMLFFVICTVMICGSNVNQRWWYCCHTFGDIPDTVCHYSSYWGQYSNFTSLLQIICLIIFIVLYFVNFIVIVAEEL